MNDSQLVSRVINDKDIEAFETLFERYHPRIFNKCIIYVKSNGDAEELTHNIFFQAFLQLPSIQNEPFYRWLYSLTFKTCLKYASEHTRFKNHTNGNGSWIHGFSQSPEVFHQEIEHILFQIKPNQLLKILRMLPPSDSFTLLMVYQDQLNKQDICSIMQSDPRKIELNLLQARKKAVLLHKQYFPSDTAS